MMAALRRAAARRVRSAGHRTRPMLALYLWTYYSSVLAHAVFLGLPASAAGARSAWALVALPLTAVLLAPLWTRWRAPLTRPGR